jgi:O-antigen/teichoic acid export membrane protein
MSRVLVSIGAIQILIMLVAMVRAKVLSVLLGPASYGVASTIDQTMLSVMQLAHLSLPFTAMKFLSRRHSDGQEPFERTYATFVRALSLLGLAAVAVVVAILTWRPGLFGADLAAYRPYFYLAIFTVPAAMLNILFVNTLAAARRGASSAMVNMLVLLALATAAITGVLVHGIAGLYVATVVTSVATTLATAWYLRRTLGVHVTAPTEGLLRELRASPEIVTYALMIYTAMAAYSLTLLGTRYFVFDELGAVGAGHLQALLGIALTVGAVMTPMNGYFLTPYVNRQLPVERKAKAANDFAGMVVLLLLVGGVTVSLFPRLVLTVLFSAKFTPAASALYLFVIWQCFYQVVNVYLQLLIGFDEVGYFAFVTCIGYAVAATLFRASIERFGLGGAAIALSSAMVVCIVGSAWRLRAKFNVTIPPLIWMRGAYCLVAVAGAGLLFAPGTEGTLNGAGARLAYAAAAFGLVTLTLTVEERAMLGAGLSWGRRRARVLGGVQRDRHAS